MTSAGPYTQSHNFTHMFDMVDLRAPDKKFDGCPGTLLHTIRNNPEFSYFEKIITKSKATSILSDEQANFTLFVVNDKFLKEIVDEEYFNNMDIGTALTILKCSMLDRKITSDLLKNSPSSNFITKKHPNRLYVTNHNGMTQIDNHINIVEFDILCTNGVIHVIDRFITPIFV